MSVSNHPYQLFRQHIYLCSVTSCTHGASALDQHLHYQHSCYLPAVQFRGESRFWRTQKPKPNYTFCQKPKPNYSFSQKPKPIKPAFSPSVNELGCCGAKQHTKQGPRQPMATTGLTAAVTPASLLATLWTAQLPAQSRATVFVFLGS